jgi:hypothetical protein
LSVPMGIRFLCPSGHKLNVKNFLAGKRAICPQCGAKVIVPDLPAEQAVESSSVDEIAPNPFAAPPGPATPALFDTASPSVVLEVAESAVIAPSAASGLPESVFAVSRTLEDVAEPAGSPSETHLELRRDQTRRNQMMLLVVLAMVVIILAGVLIWVLNRNATPPVEEETKAAALDGWHALTAKPGEHGDGKVHAYPASRRRHATPYFFPDRPQADANRRA